MSNGKITDVNNVPVGNDATDDASGFPSNGFTYPLRRYLSGGSPAQTKPWSMAGNTGHTLSYPGAAFCMTSTNYIRMYSNRGVTPDGCTPVDLDVPPNWHP